jgi:hypothetical protein
MLFRLAIDDADLVGMRWRAGLVGCAGARV